MTMATRGTGPSTALVRKARSLQEQLVDKHKDRVRKFERFSLPELDIKIYNPLEILQDRNGEMDPIKATRAAILMENFLVKTLTSNLDETSRASMPAWVKNGLALIAAAQADDLIDKVISDQAMPNRLGRIHFLDIVSERPKGQIADRARIFDSLNGFRGTQDFSSENIEGEPIGATGGTDFVPTVGYGPIIPRSLVLTDGTLVVRDDGNGNLIGDVGATGGGITNTVDYLSRIISVRFSGATSGNQVRASYQYNIEAALQLPEYGIALRHRNVQARARALGASWSQQSIIDFVNDFGIDVEPTIIEAGARLIAAETFKHVVNTLRNNATGGTVVFDNTAPAAVSYRDHLKTLALYLSRLQDLVYEATQTVRPNVLVIHPSILFAIAFQDGFEGQKFANDGVAGPRMVGRLTRHDIDVIVDPTFQRDQGVLTYRGPEFVSTAAVKGTYIALWKSPLHVRNFRKDFALLTEYALEVINPNAIGTLQMVGL